MLHSVMFLFFSCSCLLYMSGAYAMPQNNQKPLILPKEVHDAFLSEVKKCAGENHENLTEIVKFVREGTYKTDDDYKHYIFCAYKRLGYSNEDGTLKLEKVASVYPDPEAMLKILKQCDKERGQTPVDNSFLFFKCYQKNTPYLIVL